MATTKYSYRVVILSKNGGHALHSETHNHESLASAWADHQSALRRPMVRSVELLNVLDVTARSDPPAS